MSFWKTPEFILCAILITILESIYYGSSSLLFIRTFFNRDVCTLYSGRSEAHLREEKRTENKFVYGNSKVILKYYTLYTFLYVYVQIYDFIFHTLNSFVEKADPND